MAPAMDPFSFRFESRLAAPAAEVWAHATTMKGINAELFPLARMTSPRVPLEAKDIVPGRRVMRSWILALGVLPIDYDDLTFAEFEEGRRFLERSPMLSQRLWEHERIVSALPGGCSVVDRVRFEPRVRLLGVLQLPVFRMTFANRHRQLARRFGRL
jgi:ligand-binding SRPBCC domain-containing protein